MATKGELEKLLIGQPLDIVCTEPGDEYSRRATVKRVTVAQTEDYAELWCGEDDAIVIDAEDIDGMLCGERVTYFRKYGETEKVVRQNNELHGMDAGGTGAAAHRAHAQGAPR